MNRWQILVPVKRLSAVKRRLGLSPDDRASLMLAMLRDVVAAVRRCESVSAVHVIGADVGVSLTARELHVPAWYVTGARGLNAELREAAARVRQTGSPDGIGAVVGDLPCLTAPVLAELLSSAVEGRQSFLRDLRGSGTTLLLAPSGTRLNPMFGADSSVRHRCVAEALMDGSSRWAARQDVDNMTDLRLAVQLGVGPNTDRW